MKLLKPSILLFLFIAKNSMADEDYYYDDDEPDRDSSYGSSVGGGINPLAALIAPLAGLALLGAAAAVSINPVLVQLAVVNGGRRKRNAHEHDMATNKKLSDIDTLENFLFKHHNFNDQTENLAANYLDCSGLASDKNQCIERLVCIYAAPELENHPGSVSKEEREVISIILYQLLSNKFVDSSLKLRMKYAGQLTRILGGQCQKYRCPYLD